MPHPLEDGALGMTNPSMEELQIVIRNQPKGREATPWLEPYRERFAKAAREAAKELKRSKVRGADKVRLFNSLVSQKLRSLGPGSP